MVRRDATVTAAVLLGATGALAGCGDRIGFAAQPIATRALAPLAAPIRSLANVPRTAVADSPTVEAAIDPRRIVLPHAEIGGHLEHRPESLALEFAAKAGQVLEVRLEQDAAAAPRRAAQGEAPQAGKGLAALAVSAPAATARAAELRVLIVADDITKPRYAELAAPAAGTAELFLRLPADGDYVVKLRPPGTGLYRLALELHAPLPFPVTGYDHTAIESYFGASRESGARRHEGVDIFVPRLTPVVAVADGRVSLHVEGRGGIAVVLSIAGISYYYAHLDRTAVGDGERVKIGDVLGYVGNTGNAGGLAPHLHFGVYEFGKGAVDPLPLLEERRFAEADDVPFAVVAAALTAEAADGHAVGGAQVIATAAPGTGAGRATTGASPGGVERDSARAGDGGASAASTTGGGASGGSTIGGAASGGELGFTVAALAAAGGGCHARVLAETFVGATSAVVMVEEWSGGNEQRYGSLASSGAAVLCTGGT